MSILQHWLNTPAERKKRKDMDPSENRDQIKIYDGNHEKVLLNNIEDPIELVFLAKHFDDNDQGLSFEMKK